MRQSKLFTRTRREAPSDEVAKNAQLLVRAGYIHKEMAGVYDYLPLGLRTLNKIIAIIREEMNAIGGEEVFLSALQDPESWKKSGRWDDSIVDVWFKTHLKNGGELGLGNTHEEALTALMTEHISSYKDLPRPCINFKQSFATRRAQNPASCAREFIMKDLYSFSTDAASHNAFMRKPQLPMKIYLSASVLVIQPIAPLLLAVPLVNIHMSTRLSVRPVRTLFTLTKEAACVE